jgi:hypothetical protein
MQDFYLKAASEADLFATLIAAGLLVERLAETDADGHIMTPAGYDLTAPVALDLIGTIYKPTGVMLTGEDGTEYPETAPVPGYHANLRGDLTAEQAAAIAALCIAEPANPARVWA